MLIHVNDCSEFDHCNHSIFDAAIDLAKTSLGEFRRFGGSLPPKMCLDKTLVTNYTGTSKDDAHSIRARDIVTCISRLTVDTLDKSPNVEPASNVEPLLRQT